MKKSVSFLSFLFACLFLFTSFDSSSQNSEKSGLSADLLKVAEAKMQEHIDAGKLVGFSTLVIKNGQVAQRANLGFATEKLRNRCRTNLFLECTR